MVSHGYAVDRLKDLKDWADYILNSLTQDQEWEQGNVEMLTHMVGNEGLEQARQETRVLAQRLNELLSASQAKVPVA